MHDLYRSSGAADFGISQEQFALIVAQAPGPEHIADLVLARACAAGNETAWERLVRLYRDKLYSKALSITRNECAARDLADSLFADLFGPRFNSYSGRGPLDAWLRAVMMREHIDRIRRDRPAESAEELRCCSAEPFDATPLENAIDHALEALGAEDRFILASYYVDGRTLADIANVLAVHESTISRRMGRITKGLRSTVIRDLRGRGFSARAVDELLSTDVRDLQVDVRRRLVGAS